MPMGLFLVELLPKIEVNVTDIYDLSVARWEFLED